MGKSKVPPPGWGSGKGLKGLFQGIRNKFFTKRTANYRRLAALVASIVLVAVTLAWLSTTTNEEVNAFGAGTTDINVVEPNVPDKENVPWGADSKNVKISMEENETNNPAVVRVLIVPVLKDTSGNILEGKFAQFSEPTGTEMVLGDFTFHFDASWSSNWMYKDGFFYYRKVLNPGEETPYLLKGVTLTDASKAADYVDKKVHIEVYASAVQTQAADDWGLKVDEYSNVSFK